MADSEVTLSHYESAERATSPDFIFSQYAQDPLEDFTERFPPLKAEPQKPSRKNRCQKQTGRKPKKQNKKVYSSHIIEKPRRCEPASFVLNSEPCKGHRLIQIQIVDLSNSQQQRGITTTDNAIEYEDSVLLNAQYVVKDATDEIMDQTERLISNISKKLCNYSYNYNF